jgi:hypothetical protein
MVGRCWVPLRAATVAVLLYALRWHYFTDTVAGAAVGISAGG